MYGWDEPNWNELFYEQKEDAMYECVVCHFEVPMDDACCLTTDGKCTCTRCYRRLTESERPVDKSMRRDINQLLAGMGMDI